VNYCVLNAEQWNLLETKYGTNAVIERLSPDVYHDTKNTLFAQPMPDQDNRTSNLFGQNSFMTGSYLHISEVGGIESSVGIISESKKMKPSFPNFPALGVPDFCVSESSSEMASSVAPSEIPLKIEENKVISNLGSKDMQKRSFT